MERRRIMMGGKPDGFVEWVHFDGNTYFDFIQQDYRSNPTVYGNVISFSVKNIVPKSEVSYLYGRCQTIGYIKSFLAVNGMNSIETYDGNHNDVNFDYNNFTSSKYIDINGDEKTWNFAESLTGATVNKTPKCLGAAGFYNNRAFTILNPAIFDFSELHIGSRFGNILYRPYRKKGVIGLMDVTYNFWFPPLVGKLTEV